MKVVNKKLEIIIILCPPHCLLITCIFTSPKQLKVFSPPSLWILSIHVSLSEQPCRVSWVLREASSWADYEHKRCFHGTLLSAVWILPQAFISMAAAFSLIPGFCICMCASARALRCVLAVLVWLKCPSRLQLNPLVLFSPVGFLPYSLLHTVFPSGWLFILSFFSSWFFYSCSFVVLFNLAASSIFTSRAAMFSCWLP